MAWGPARCRRGQSGRATRPCQPCRRRGSRRRGSRRLPCRQIGCPCRRLGHRNSVRRRGRRGCDRHGRHRRPCPGEIRCLPTHPRLSADRPVQPTTSSPALERPRCCCHHRVRSGVAVYNRAHPRPRRPRHCPPTCGCRRASRRSPAPLRRCRQPAWPQLRWSGKHRWSQCQRAAARGPWSHPAESPRGSHCSTSGARHQAYPSSEAR